MTLTNNVCADTAYMNELATEWELCDDFSSDCYPASLVPPAPPAPMALPPPLPHAPPAAPDHRAVLTAGSVGEVDEGGEVSSSLPSPLAAYALAIMGLGRE